MLSEWNIISTIIVILLIIFVPVISSDPADNILNLTDVNDNDIFSELQQTNNTNITLPSLFLINATTTAATITNNTIELIESKIRRSLTTLLLPPIANNNNIIPQKIKKV